MTDLGKTLRLGDLEKLQKHSSGLYLKNAEPWQVELFGQNVMSKGDCIYNSCRKVIEDNDQSDWAFKVLDKCSYLLFNRKRWIDGLNHPLDAENWIEYQWYKLTYNVGCSPWMLYRPQYSLTRDPIIYFYALCVHLNRIQFIEAITVPIHLFRLNLWLWRRSLITGKRSWLYELIERKPNHKEDYVNLLRWYRMKAYKQRTNQS